MSDFYNTVTRPKAAKPHRCIYCAAAIPKGEVHWHQTGRYDGAWFANRYHDECWDALIAEGDFEFMPGEGDPPQRIRAAQEGK